jgi:hypothetical protein
LVLQGFALFLFANFLENEPKSDMTLMHQNIQQGVFVIAFYDNIPQDLGKGRKGYSDIFHASLAPTKNENLSLASVYLLFLRGFSRISGMRQLR